MITMMPNGFAQGISLLLFLSTVKGVEFHNFYITDIECIDGNVTVTMICNVNNTGHGITILRNNDQIAYCAWNDVLSSTTCTNSNRQYKLTNLTIVNASMIYRIESASIDNLIGTWVCQNGGPKDPSWSLSFPNITCPPKNNPATKCDHENDMVKRKRIADIFMMLAPLIGCGVLTFITIPAKQTVLRVMCVVVCLVYSILSILIIENDMNIGATIGLTIFCLLIGIAFAIIAVWVIRKTK
ncbi:uncharacterized protein LOC143058980 [Mytilus galloprovincialis]|uniref:uncharacterized protein LOC143058980 n=1 Tax=Mytilus galloprovincialis TaxID=29158 RepID=UPI003F7CB3B0